VYLLLSHLDFFSDVAKNLMNKEEAKEGFVSNLDAESTKASRRKNPSRLALGR
jgi:hypothetical protein